MNRNDDHRDWLRSLVKASGGDAICLITLSGLVPEVKRAAWWRRLRVLIQEGYVDRQEVAARTVYPGHGKYHRYSITKAGQAYLRGAD